MPQNPPWPYPNVFPSGLSVGQPVPPAALAQLALIASTAADGRIWSDASPFKNIMYEGDSSTSGNAIVWNPVLKEWFSFGSSGGNPTGIRTAHGRSFTVLSITAGSGLIPLAAAVNPSGVMVIGGNFNGTAKYRRSTDGSTWASQNSTNGGTPAVNAIEWIPMFNMFVAALSSSLIETSPDGVTWTARATGTNQWSDIAYRDNGDGSGLIVVGGSTFDEVMTSTNGTSYTARTVNATGDTGTVVYHAELDKFYACSFESLASPISSSQDGINWSATGLGSPTNNIRRVRSFRRSMLMTGTDGLYLSQTGWTTGTAEKIDALGGLGGAVMAISPSGQLATADTSANRRHYFTFQP